VANYIPLSPAQVAASRHIEAQREALCMTLPCPSCAVREGQYCRGVGSEYGSSHLGRYRAAAALGLVPKLVGDRG